MSAQAGPMQGVDAVLFDVDGTLWDARESVCRSWNRTILRAAGQRDLLTVEEITPYFGRTMEEIAAALFPSLPQKQRLGLARQCFDDEIAWLQLHPGTLYPQVAEVLRRLSQRYRLYLVSNCQSGYMETMLAAGRLEPFFSGRLCWGDTGEGKAENLVTLCTRERLQTPVYVGDTQGDAEACSQAGIPMIWAAYGFGRVECPERSIETFAQLEEYL